MSHNDNPHDERISRLYRLGSSGEPPAHLDRKILDEAARAVGRRRWVRALPSLATAAVLVLSFTLLLRVMEQRPLDRPMQLDETIEQDVVVTPPQEEESDADAVVDEVNMAAPSQAPDETATTSRKAAKWKPQQPAKAAERKRKMEVVERQPASYMEPQLQDEMAEPQVGGAADAAQTKGAVVAAPSVAVPVEEKRRKEMESAVEGKGCGVELPAAGLPVSVWQQRHKELLDQGKSEQARCLSEIFEQRFGYKLELSQKP